MYVCPGSTVRVPWSWSLGTVDGGEWACSSLGTLAQSVQICNVDQPTQGNRAEKSRVQGPYIPIFLYSYIPSYVSIYLLYLLYLHYSTLHLLAVFLFFPSFFPFSFFLFPFSFSFSFFFFFAFTPLFPPLFARCFASLFLVIALCPDSSGQAAIASVRVRVREIRGLVYLSRVPTCIG